MSFVSVIEQLDGLEVPVDGPGLADAVACHDRFTAKLTVAVGVFDAAGEWDVDGATSATAWLRDRGMTAPAAAQLTQLGSKLHRLPVLAGAWMRGDVTGGQVRVVAAQVVERHMSLFALHEDAVVAALVGLSVPDTARAIAEWRAKADALDEGIEPGMPEQSLHHSATMDGRWQTTATWDAEGGDVIATALRLASVNDLELPAARRRAQALVDICRHFLDHQQTKTGGRHRPHLNIIVKAESLGSANVEGFSATSGTRFDSPTLERLLCDCAVHRVVVNSAGTILDYGRATRTPPVNLYNAVVVRDQHCRHPGCDRPAHWCEAHHVVPWENGGETSITNLVLLCSRHHHRIHLPGHLAKLKPDGELSVTAPWGDIRTTRPPGHIDQPRLDLIDAYEPTSDQFEEHLDSVHATHHARTRIKALKTAASAA